MKNFFAAWFIVASAFSASHCLGQLEDANQDFSAPVQWGPGSLMMQWGATPGQLRMKGDEGMSDKSGEYFAVIKAGEWQPVESETHPYIRTIVSRVDWPLGFITDKDVGKTVKFSGLFGWYGGELERGNDLSLSCGFFVGDTLAQGLENGQDFEFGSVREKEWVIGAVPEKEWAKISISYKIRREDIGQDLRFMVEVRSRSEAPGLPVLATADWKVTVTP